MDVTDPVIRGLEPFDRFYHREYDVAVRLALVLSGRRRAAGVVAAETFTEAYRRWEEIGRYEDPAGWIRRAVSNQSVSRYRMRAAEARGMLKALVGAREEVPGPAAKSEEVWEAVRRLPRRQAQVVALTYLEKLPTDEIGVVLDVPVSTVANQLHRGRRAMADDLVGAQEAEETPDTRLDTRLSDAAIDTRRKVSGLAPPSLDSRISRWAALGWSAAATAAVVIAMVFAPRLEVGLPETVVDPTEDRPFASEVQPGESVLAEEPLVVRGASGPQPRFDTSSLGEETPLEQVDDVSHLVDRVDEAGLTVVRRLAKVVVAGATDEGKLGALVIAEETGTSPSWCLWMVRDSDSTCVSGPEEALPVVGMHRAGLIWGVLPTDTSVVMLRAYHDDTTFWQHPVGGIVLFDHRLRSGDEEFALTALDENGDTLAVASS